MRQLSWEEVRDYWEVYIPDRSEVDLDRDPDALDNVCHPGAPPWLNAYYGIGQLRVYESLLDRVIPAHGHALDVGCGAGRWCRVLSKRGYDVTGIDLQERLIDANRAHHPRMQFERTAIQDFTSGTRFGLLSSVTVLAHNPVAEQVGIIAKLRDLVADGGHVLILENVHDQAPHVFSHSIGTWREMFQHGGFRLVALQRYDFSPTIRTLQTIRSVAARAARGAGAAGRRANEEVGRPGTSTQRSQGLAHQIDRLALRLAVSVDEGIEPQLVQRQARLPSVHCGFLFTTDS